METNDNSKQGPTLDAGKFQAKDKLIVSICISVGIIILAVIGGFLFPAFAILSWLIWVGGLIAISTSVNKYFQRQNKLAQSSQISGANVPKPKNSIAKIVGWVCLVLMVAGTGYGCDQAFGGTKETPIAVPSFLEGAQIGFDIPVYFEIGKPQESTKTFQTIKRAIATDKSMGQYYPGQFQYQSVPEGEKFSVVKAVNEAQYGLSSIDSGTEGVNYLILQDSNGQQAFIAYVAFDANFIQDSSYKITPNTSVASYYINGEKMGKIIFSINNTGTQQLSAGTN